MSITTYTDLQTSIADWLHRTDLATVIPDFIKLAESRLNKDLKARAMEVRATAVTVASNAYVTLPGDVLECRRLLITSTDPDVILKYKTPDELQRLYPYTTTGQPVYYTIIGSSIQFAPIPDAAYSLELTYKQSLPNLAANSTNWLLTAYPDAYLYGSLLAAQGYIYDDARLAMFHDMYKETIDGINKVDWYTGTTMTVSHD